MLEPLQREGLGYISNGLNRFSVPVPKVSEELGNDDPLKIPKGLAVLKRALEQAVGAGKGVNKFAAIKAYEPPSAEEVAATVLGFISRNLQAASNQGADKERLAHILTESAKGVEQGYQQAVNDLKHLGLLPNEGLEADIGKTHDLLQAGLGDLKQQFIAPETAPSNVVPFTGSVSVSSSRAYEQVQTFDLQVQTQEGDVVTISVAQHYSQYQREQVALSADGSAFSASAAFFQSSSASVDFSYSIKGDLNKDEKAALDDLLKQVGDLADTFYEGNGEATLQKALSLGYNTQEISQFSLQLTELDVRQITDTYHQVASLGEQQPIEAYSLNDGLQALGDYARRLLDAIDTASAFKNPVQLIHDLFDKVLEHDPRNKDDLSKTALLFDTLPHLLRDFTEQLLEAVD